MTSISKIKAINTVPSYVRGRYKNFVLAKENDGVTWNRDVFDAGFNAGLQGAAVGMTTSLTSGLLGQMNLGSKLEKVLGFNSGQIEDMQTFNKTIGGLAGQGVNYALGGDFTMNALNLSMLKINIEGERLEGGLFEVRFGREGVSTAIGAGGVDMSLGTLIDSAGGFVSSARIGGAKVASLFGNERDISTINSINYLGYTDDANTELARKIWEGKIKATYKDLGVDEKGNINLGEFNRNNKDEIFLSESLLGNKDKELSAKLATVMAHEGTHLNGNRYEGMAHLQGLETYNAINAKFGLEDDGGFYSDMALAIMNPESWVENTGDVDNWRLMEHKNGTYDMYNDGTDNVTVVDERGNVKRQYNYTVGDKAEFLAGVMGISADKINETMSSAGWNLVDNQWQNTDDNSIHFGTDLALKLSNRVATAYNMPGIIPTIPSVNIADNFIVNGIIAGVASTWNFVATAGNTFVNGLAATNGLINTGWDQVTGGGIPLADAGITIASNIPGPIDDLFAMGYKELDIVANSLLSNIRVLTPYGTAYQSLYPSAMLTRSSVENGAILWRIGKTGTSNTADAQFWALLNPTTPGYANKLGIPPANMQMQDFILNGVLKPGTPFIVRRAPGLGINKGGLLEVVVPPNGVSLNAFSGW